MMMITRQRINKKIKKDWRKTSKLIAIAYDVGDMVELELLETYSKKIKKCKKKDITTIICRKITTKRLNYVIEKCYNKMKGCP